MMKVLNAFSDLWSPFNNWDVIISAYFGFDSDGINILCYIYIVISILSTCVSIIEYHKVFLLRTMENLIF